VNDELSGIAQFHSTELVRRIDQHLWESIIRTSLPLLGPLDQGSNEFIAMRHAPV
jgi:hypothetical protein